MSSKQTTTYFCDFCNTLLGTEKIDREYTLLQVTIVEEMEFSADRLVANHLCSECQHEVKEFVRAMRRRK